MCRDIHWKWSRKYGLSAETVRHAQKQQFEIETAAAEAAIRDGGKPGGRGRAGGGGDMTIVQTEDENGIVVP
jgi:hypothetical protein